MFFLQTVASVFKAFRYIFGGDVFFHIQEYVDCLLDKIWWLWCPERSQTPSEVCFLLLAFALSGASFGESKFLGGVPEAFSRSG